MTEVNELAHGALDKLEECIHAGEIGTAVVYFDRGEDQPFTMWDQTYWANANTIENFEERAARHAKELGSKRFAFAADAIIASDESGVYMRPPNIGMGLRDHETEVMWLIAVDLEIGIEIGKVDVIRTEDGIGFGELLLIEGQTQFEALAPGYGIIRNILA